MTKGERLNWIVAIVGLVASLLSIFAFVTGAQSIPGLSKKPEPKPDPVVIIQRDPVAVPIVKSPPPTPGDKIVAPIKNGVNWATGRLKPRSHSTTAQPPPDATKH